MLFLSITSDVLSDAAFRRGGSERIIKLHRQINTIAFLVAVPTLINHISTIIIKTKAL